MPKTICSAQKFLSLSLLLSLLFISNYLYSQQKTLGVTKYLKGHAEDGYVLYSPVGSDTTFLINKCGKKVHKWVSAYGPGLSLYLLPNGHLLRTGSYTDTGFGIAGGRGGIIEEFDWDNKLLWRYKLFNDSLCQHHDIKPLPNGNILILAWHAISKSKAIALGRDSNSFANGNEGLWGERIIEIKPYGLDSANIIWQWDLFDHVIQNKKTTLPNYGAVAQHPELMDINYALNLKTFDWIHANGIDYNADLDQIVISCHNISEFWIIDHSTTISQARSHAGGLSGKGGDLLYRWGNPEAYQNGTSANRKLFKQHNTHWITSGQDSGAIMLFNNGWDRDTAYSTVEVIRTTVNSFGKYGNNIPYGPATQNWIYKDSIPTDFYSKIISGAQRLPNGNTLICSGVLGKFFEITPQNKTVWEYRCPVNVMSQTVQSDGDIPVNNSVFRCEFYKNNYQGFSGRILTPTGTVEKNPYPFACNYDRTPPKILSLTPPKNQTAVGASPVLKIIFNEPVTKKTGNILIFQNKTLIETIAVTNTKIKVVGSQVTIQQTVPFALNSRISILIPNKAFSDSSYNLTTAIDTSDWYFFTETRFGTVAFTPPHLSANNSPYTPLSVTFADSITKAGSGNIYIYENAVLKEQIPVGNSNVNINGKTANISPSVPFAQDANVSIVVESCFKNSKGGLNLPVASGTWTFKTLTSPKITKLIPAHLANSVPVSTSISIDFDRPIKVGNPDYLLIYENSVLIDSIMVNGPRAMISGNFINFDLDANFNHSSYISIALRPNTIQDTMGAYFSGIDSSQWHFSVEAKVSISNSAIVNGFKVYPNPGRDLFRISSVGQLESAELFTLTGQKIPVSLFRINDNTSEVRLKDVVSGHYMLLLNGAYTVMIEVQ